MKEMGNLISLLFLFFLWSSTSSDFGVVSGATTSEECSNDLQKVMNCLSYATGKTNTPSKDCCRSVKEVKDSDPKCLCYMMLQTHNGSAQVKSLGIQEARLLQLPSACQLQNASVSFCPGLLGLSPSSPDAAIFTNASSPATPATSSGTSATETIGSSNEAKHRPRFSGPSVIAMAIFISVINACMS
uniref:Non-specific lipid transfer protein GPI-anchored 1-like n=1 Tax=Rhizophora mucronata TaxID=61149 RepID=A0A2P2PMG2_RHIMU